jgi:hypothetical protein
MNIHERFIIIIIIIIIIIRYIIIEKIIVTILIKIYNIVNFFLSVFFWKCVLIVSVSWTF